MTDQFWEGGECAWWRGLREAIKTATERLQSAATEEEKSEVQSKLDRLSQQQADAEVNGHKWIF